MRFTKNSIKTMRRWGVSYKSIIKCLLGFHHNNPCGRCGG